MKKIMLGIGLLIIIAVAAGGLYVWSAYSSYMKVKVIEYDPLLKIYIGGGNSIVLTSEDGKSALIVDTKRRDAAKELRGHVYARNITIINTHFHHEHTGGNALYPGARIIAGDYTQKQWERELGRSVRYPDFTLKPGEEEVLTFGNETVRIINMGRAHTWNDLVVYLEKRQLLVTGDLVFHRMHPMLIKDNGSHVASWIRALETLSSSFKVLTVVPGHGPMADARAIEAMKNYFVSVQNAVNNTDELSSLKKKYDDYFGFPCVFSFDQTVSFIQNERD